MTERSGSPPAATRVPAGGEGTRPADGTATHGCPADRGLRNRLRRHAADLVAPWRETGVPVAARAAAGLETLAQRVVAAAGGGPEHAGWTMVAIVSEHWRRRLAAGAAGRRLLLLPDCPLVDADEGDGGAARPPHTCGPDCVIGTLWAAAREAGWVVESTPRAMAGIGGLLTGEYDGILGVARLSHLEKAFAMLPAFALPIAAVPFDPDAARSKRAPSAPDGGDCATAAARAALDVEWVLGLLGCAGGAVADGADHLPLLREAATLFRPEALDRVAAEAGVGWALAWGEGKPVPLDSAATLSADYLCRGGKFLRPFITLAAHDAVVADRGGVESSMPASRAAAVAVEVFHKASLIHDDIEDSDRRRYGRSTLHEEVGIPVAINTGDALLGLGYRIVSTLPGIEAGCRGELVAMLAEAHVRLSRGQGAELWWRDAADKSLSVAESIEIYALKTSPAFEVSLAMGIRLAGLAPHAAGPLDRYARHVGVGFQILNDLKDWAGDAENDRHAAGDLLGGRPTLLWALARERVDAADLARLAADASVADGPGAARVIADARRLFSAADVFARAVAIAEAERAAAIAAVAAFPLPRLRSVLGFLLDLAVPGGAAERIVSG